MNVWGDEFRLAFETAPVAMAMIDLFAPSARLLQVNPAMCTLTGRTAEQLRDLDLDDISHPDDTEANGEMIEHLGLDHDRVIQGEKRFCRPDGTTVWGQLALSVVSPGGGRAAYGICLVEDITARKRAEEALVHRTLHDSLTGLPNRILLRDRIAHALAASSRSHHLVGLLYIDLDGFKQVNDRAGHAAGDELLVSVAHRLGQTVRPGDTIARISGDEFAVVCVDVVDLVGLRTAAARVLEALSTPFRLTTGTHHISGSIGMVLSDQLSRPEAMLEAADAAMYAAKDGGKNRVATSGAGTRARATEAVRLLPALNTAVRQGQLLVYGQPIVHRPTGTVTAVETTIRWRHPVLGILGSSELLDVAERSPMVTAIGRRALGGSCRMAAGWGRTGRTAPDVHVAISGHLLESGHLVKDVLTALGASGLEAGRLVLGIAETDVPAMGASLRADLGGLRDLGVRIAVDDFGTGGTSLAQLTQLPVDLVKIGRGTVAGIGQDPGCEALVRVVVGVGRALGLAVIAGGVETAAQAELLGASGCDDVQGSLYSPPRAENELEEYLVAHATETTFTAAG